MPPDRGNLLNILRQIAPLMIVAVAMTFVITTGGIDLSVSSILALVNALAAITLQAGVPWPAVVVLMLLLDVGVGVFRDSSSPMKGFRPSSSPLPG
jgi:simple sugar transport system permease protein